VPTTTTGLFRYPASTAAPNVPQDVQNLATDADSALVRARWVDLFVSATTYNSGVTATTFTTLSGHGTFTTAVVPTGAKLEVEWSAPLVGLPAGTGMQARLLIGGTVPPGASWYWTNSNAAAIGGPIFLKGIYTGTGTTVSVVVQVLKVGTGTPTVECQSLAASVIRARIV
jgi:hypothetical protein